MLSVSFSEKEDESRNELSRSSVPSITTDQKEEVPTLMLVDGGHSYPKTTCNFCGKKDTYQYCFARKPTLAGAIYRNVQGHLICGKAYCMVCMENAGYNEGYGNRCIDCKNAAECNTKINEEHATEVARKPYTDVELEGMDLKQLKQLCEDSGIDVGKKRKPGCIRALKEKLKE